MLLQGKRLEFCRHIAREILREYRKRRKRFDPPVPVEELALWLGFQVVKLTSAPDALSALVNVKEKLIGINGKHHRHRQRFSLCHELAHILLYHPPESRCTNREISLYNAEADECAAELLMPEEMVMQWYSLTKNVRELARIFDVSPEAMTRKIAELQTAGSRWPIQRNGTVAGSVTSFRLYGEKPAR